MDFFDKNLHNSFYPIDKNIHPKSYFPDYKSSILRSPKKHLVSIDTIISDLYGNVSVSYTHLTLPTKRSV